MAFTTYTAFVAALMDISISGVTKAYDAPPTQISTASLPILYPAFPDGSNGVVAFSGGAGLTSATCDMVIAIEPVRQSLPNVNYAAALTLMDASETAIAAAALAIGIDEWAMRVEQNYIGDTVYWMMIISVEASG